MNNQIEELLTTKIEWKSKFSLKSHTIKHPINETDNYQNWQNALNFSNIAKSKNDISYKETELRYENKSKEILYDKNAIGYYKKGKNKDDTPYYSIGLFLNDNDTNEKQRLITYIQRVDKYKKSKPYIASCHFRQIDFAAKFYYAYQILENPNEFFTYQISKEGLLKAFDINPNFDLKEIHRLVENSEVSSDRLGQIYFYYFKHNEINIDYYNYLKFSFMNSDYIKKIKDINNKIKKMKFIISYLEKEYISNTVKKTLIPSEQFIDNFKKWCENNEELKRYLPKIVNISKNRIKLHLLDNETYLKKCRTTLWLILLKYYCKINNLSVADAIEYNWENDVDILMSRFAIGSIKLIKERIIELEKNKNKILYELSMRDEEMFELCLIKTLGKKASDYNEEYFDGLGDLENKYKPVIEKYIK